MAKVRFTARLIDSIKAPATGRVEYWDAGEPGFGLRVSDHGRKTWVVMYRHEGRLRRYTLGTYPKLSLADARDKASKALRDAALGKDPAGEKKTARLAETFGELAEQYMADYAKPNKKSWREDRRALDRDLLPTFKNRKALSISRGEMRTALRDIKNRGAPILANRTLEIVRGIYRWGVDEEILPLNPFAGMAPIAEKQKRDRVLTDDEIKMLWNALGHEAPDVAARFRLQLLTAQRPGELRQMRRPDVDLETAWWLIPGEFTKNGNAHRVPLVAAAVEILRDRKERAIDPVWVFPSPTRGGKPVQTNTHPVERLRAATGIEFTPHDLRRTVATNITGLGISRFIVSRVLNHTDPSVTGVYDLYEYDREKRAALEAWARRLEEIVAAKRPSDAKVVPLRVEGR